MKSFLKYLLLVPLAVIAVALAVANRQIVTFSFDPFSTDVPAFALTGPLFVVVLVVVVIGVVIGGVATWLGQGRKRRALRAARRDNEALRRDVDRLKADLEEARGAGDRLLALPGREAA